MAGAGQQVGEARIWTGPFEQRAVSELVRDRRGLFLFYLFDWSST